LVTGQSAVDGKLYTQMIIEMAAKGIDDNGDPNGPIHGLELLSSLFEAFLGKAPALDHLMKPTFELQWQLMKSNKLDRQTKGALLKSWSTLMLYNTLAFLQMLQEADLVADVFKEFQDPSVVRTYEGKKAWLLAFSELLKVTVSSPNSVPSLITGNVNGLVRQLTEQRQQLTDLRRKLEEEESDSDSSADAGDSEEDLDEDEDARDKTHMRVMQRVTGDAAGDVCGEDESDEDDESYETSTSVNHMKCGSALEDVDAEQQFAKLLMEHRAVFAAALDSNELSKLDESIAASQQAV